MFIVHVTVKIKKGKSYAYDYDLHLPIEIKHHHCNSFDFAMSGYPTTENDAARRYIVQVKSEYVLSERAPCLSPPQENPPVTAVTVNEEATPDTGRNNDGRGPTKNKNKNRGQNTKRPRDSKIEFGDKACLAVVRGEPCPFLQTPKGCRYNHDLKEMLANRPADLNEGEDGAEWLKGECPFWKSRGLVRHY